MHSHLRTCTALALAASLAGSCRLAASPNSPTDLYQRVSASAVTITTHTGSGSGTVILSGRAGSLILTAQHVVEAEGRLVEIGVPYLRSGHEGATKSRARVLLVDRDRDLALVRSDEPLAAPALPVAAAEPDLYEEIYMVAAPLGLAGTATPGLVTAKLEREGTALWEVTGLTLFGSSGGTVANARGELVAVPVLVSSWNGLPISQIGFAVPLASIHTFLDRAVAAGALDL